jgi:methanogenic corrinoid protein MtbC1
VYESLAEELSGLLERVPCEAAEAYAGCAGPLAEDVGRTLGAREDLLALPACEPVASLFASPTDHSGWMASQLLLRSGPALVRTVVWAYRTHLARGFPPGYFPLELALWREAIARHVDPGAAGPIDALDRLLIERHSGLLALARSEPPASPGDGDLRERREAYLAALLRPDAREAVRVSGEYIRGCEDIPAWWQRVVQPALYAVGQRWAEGRITVGQEHLATAITQRVMAVFYPLILERPRERGRAIVAATAGELHEIGARIVADVLEMNGWDVVYTGADTPAEGLLGLVARHAPRCLCLSTTLVANLPRVQALIGQLKARHPGVSAFVGGQAYLGDAQLWRRVGADGYAADASELVARLERIPVAAVA